MNEYSALLGEIDELKKQLDTLRPLENPSLLHGLDIEYTYESNRIEGNTLTLRETEIIINKGLTVGGKSMREHLETINHHEAVLFLRDLVQNGTPLSESLVRQIHSLVLRGIDRDNAGRYRTVPVMISGSRHTPPQPWQLPSLMEACCRWYDEERLSLHPVTLAAELHERLATIHPFIDGNGRTARLIMNLVLLGAGYPIANIGGDTESRLSYYNSLETCNLGGDKSGFLMLIAGEIRKMAKRLIEISGG
ncbi:MAG: Fic family protein [Chlorobium sp.]|nr:MAG: Fic family protein [Chlorobium sp.]